VLGSKALVGEVMIPFLRTAGPSLSPFNAWVLLKGLETLDLRVKAQAAAALELARWLESHPAVERVFYPGLESHPQHALAKRQQRASGAVLSFQVKGGRAAAWRVINATQLMSITGNLGDVKTTIVHPATTTHGRINQQARDAAGITDGLIRISVGLEAVTDLQADLERGLA
jgi:O-succinylhomoserine sulfhydrylase